MSSVNRYEAPPGFLATSANQFDDPCSNCDLFLDSWCTWEEETSWCEDWAREDERNVVFIRIKEGYDSYGYSCFNSDGEYVGIGDGVDRNGYTEMDYLSMNEEWT